MSKIKYNLSDQLLDFLVAKKVNTVFLLTGGAIAFTIDAFSRNKKIKYVCVQHEQAAAMMADSYSRLKNNFAATMSTSGPGATNLITGIACSYFDSIPNIHITGQVNMHEQKGAMPGTKFSRQIGFQETDIVSISSPLTKKSIMVKSEKNFAKLLEELYSISQEGRQGPLLLDVPMNFQRLPVKKFKFNNSFNSKIKNKKILNFNITKLIDLINKSKRPVLITGGGVRYSDSVAKLTKLINLIKVPVVSTWSGIDTIDYNNSYYAGHIGVYGSRSGNFTLQNSDLVISLGSRLDTRVTGGRPETFARKANIVMIDIDKGELNKRRGLKPKIEIFEDVKFFIDELIVKLKKTKIRNKYLEWNKYCQTLKCKYPTFDNKFSESSNFVNPYYFTECLSNISQKNEVIIPDTAAHLTWFMQAFKNKLGQRIFSAYGNSPMGYSFPASIGASIALNKKRVICINGDGSFQINIQELQTVVNEKLPIKIFILNNNGYGIIKQFQGLYLGKRFLATGKGVSVPNYKKIANAYNITYFKIKNDKSVNQIIKKSLNHKGPAIIDVNIHPNQKIIPKLTFGSPIEDLSPKLNRNEFNSNMQVSIVKQDKTVIESN